MSSRIRTYSELVSFATFEDRFDYLVLGGVLGVATFGFDRWMNQSFYRSKEWGDVRQAVVLRDEGCDLGIEDRPIWTKPLVHHINPLTPQDLADHADWVLDPEFLITTTTDTHNAIHYGDHSSLPKPYVERYPGDTKLW